MSSAFSIVLLVEPDPSAPNRFRSWCPDLPNWYATGVSEQEAIDAGAQIIRGLLTMRPALVDELQPGVRAVSIPIPAPPEDAVPVGPEEPAPAANSPQGGQEQAPPRVDPAVGADRSPRGVPAESEEESPLHWRTLEAGSRARRQGIDPWEDIDDPIGDGTLLDSNDGPPRNAGYSIHRAPVSSETLALGSSGKHPHD